MMRRPYSFWEINNNKYLDENPDFYSVQQEEKIQKHDDAAYFSVIDSDDDDINTEMEALSLEAQPTNDISTQEEILPNETETILQSAVITQSPTAAIAIPEANTLSFTLEFPSEVGSQEEVVMTNNPAGAANVGSMNIEEWLSCCPPAAQPFINEYMELKTKFPDLQNELRNKEAQLQAQISQNDLIKRQLEEQKSDHAQAERDQLLYELQDQISQYYGLINEFEAIQEAHKLAHQSLKNANSIMQKQKQQINQLEAEAKQLRSQVGQYMEEAARLKKLLKDPPPKKLDLNNTTSTPPGFFSSESSSIVSILPQRKKPKPSQ